ncbi:bifunctional adenosylcobinamide kinase/adenosylcobinamide-phosphate guanylyltransferase [Candidatus Formimonas warabiya]|uniref:Adenosylcobinamide kinase n=1 Tax=Formimonas warabiya TaxID=1761012 RepID=A0A3G1L0F3_FORW1|nr:bifunctional adenosylcobinamide kinase/adenosylcobinamide-phosphate guanylyltransferase [Candidatus Formimonas warabiya]ATW28119.1 bifunctional adenosylcobinamide kinase/adenosylcobinamide-phosphate guanylyltransferase [Candidatus Formimonas warabiya]
MGKSILVTGGARSGKSKFAEKLVKDLAGPVLYVATAQVFDEEMKLRVEKHRQSRPADWATVEAYRGLGKIVADQGDRYQGILIDCITIMVTNLLFDLPEIQQEDFSRNSIEQAETRILEEAGRLAQGIASSPATIVMVTNELGSGIVPEYPLSRIFRDIAGRVNQYLAEKADEAYFVVSGIPIKLK